MPNPNSPSLDTKNVDIPVPAKVQDAITVAIEEPGISIKIICKNIANACLKQGLHHEEVTKLLKSDSFRMLAEQAAKATLHHAVVDTLSARAADCNSEEIFEELQNSREDYIHLVLMDLIDATEAAIAKASRRSIKEILKERVLNSSEGEYKLSDHAIYAIFNSPEALELLTNIFKDKLRIITERTYRPLEDLQEYDYSVQGNTLHISFPSQRSYRVFLRKHINYLNEWNKILGTSEFSFSIGDDKNVKKNKQLDPGNNNARSKVVELLERMDCYTPEQIVAKSNMYEEIQAARAS